MSSKNKQFALIFIVLAIFAVILTPFLPFSVFVNTLIIALLFVFGLGFYNPKLGLFLIILFRPCLDALSNQNIITLANFSLNLAAIVAILTIFLTIYAFFKNYKTFKFSYLIFFWLIFLFITYFSIFYSLSPVLTLIEWLRLLSIFVLFLLGLLVIKNQTDLNILLKIIIFSAVAPGLLAIYQFFTHTGMTIPMEGIYNRIYGTFAHPNLFAYYLIIPLSLSVVTFLSGTKKTVLDYIFVFFSLFYTLLLALTFTRGAWLELIIVVFIVGLFKFRKFLVIAAAFLILIYLFIPPIHNRVTDLLRLDKYSSISWRLKLWQDGISLVSAKPILGYGAGTANKVILLARGADMGSADPHNDYLKISLENGLIGLISYVLLIFSLLIALLEAYLSASEPYLKSFALLIVALTLAIFSLSFVDNIIRNTALMWVFWTLAGGLISLQTSKTKPTKKT